MSVMLDTKVLLSALLFPGERMDMLMRCIFEEHRLVLSSFVVEELHSAVERPDILTPSELIERYT